MNVRKIIVLILNKNSFKTHRRQKEQPFLGDELMSIIKTKFVAQDERATCIMGAIETVCIHGGKTSIKWFFGTHIA